MQDEKQYLTRARNTLKFTTVSRKLFCGYTCLRYKLGHSGALRAEYINTSFETWYKARKNIHPDVQQCFECIIINLHVDVLLFVDNDLQICPAQGRRRREQKSEWWFREGQKPKEATSRKPLCYNGDLMNDETVLTHFVSFNHQAGRVVEKLSFTYFLSNLDVNNSFKTCWFWLMAF